MPGFANCPPLSRNKNLGGSSLCLLFSKGLKRRPHSPLTLLNCHERFYLTGPSDAPQLPDGHFLPSVQIVAAILAIAGIVMMTYADGFHSHSVIGIALVVGSASMSALYKVSLGTGSLLSGQAQLAAAWLAHHLGELEWSLSFQRSSCSHCELGKLRFPTRHAAALGFSSLELSVSGQTLAAFGIKKGVTVDWQSQISDFTVWQGLEKGQGP